MTDRKDRPKPRIDERRVCSIAGCRTVLSSYNRGSECNPHLDEKNERRRKAIIRRAEDTPAEFLSQVQALREWHRDRRYLKSIGLEVEA